MNAQVLVFILLISTHIHVAGYFFIGHNTVSISKNLEVQGSLETAQGLTVNGAVTAHNGLSVTSGTSVLSGSLAVNGATTLTGATAVNNALSVGGVTTLSSTLGVTGATTLSNTLTVSGATTLNGATTVSNAGLSITGASGTLSVSSATTLGGTLAVGGATTMNGATTINNVLSVGGATTLSSTLDVAGAMTLKQTTINNAGLSVTGASGTLSVSGAATLSSTLGVTGATTLSNTLTVSGATTLNGATLLVSGASTFTGAATMNGGLTCNTCSCGNMPVAPATVNVPGSYATLQAAWDALSGMVVLAPITINVAKSAIPIVSATQITLTGFTRHKVTITCSGGAVAATDCTFSFSGTSGIVLVAGAFIQFSNGFKVINTGATTNTYGLLVSNSQLIVGSFGVIVQGFYAGVRAEDKSLFKCNGPISATLPATGNAGLAAVDGSSVKVVGSITSSGGMYGFFVSESSSIQQTPNTATITISGVTAYCVVAEMASSIYVFAEVTVYNCGQMGLLSSYASAINIWNCASPPCLNFPNSGSTQYGVHVIYNGVVAANGVDFGLTPFTMGYCVHNIYGGLVNFATVINKHGSVTCPY